MSLLSSYNELKITPTSNNDEFCDFLLSLGVEAVEEEGKTLIVRSEEDLEVVKWGVEQFAQQLSDTLKRDVEVVVSLETKPNQDWISLYQNSIKPIQISNFYVRPSWEEEKKGLMNIVIDPSLTFGSGHHESTYSCILSLEKYLKKNDTILDVGCGSGILSIASAKLGAYVDSCDTDEDAILSTTKNAKLNCVDLVDTWVGSVGNAEKKYDAVVANIIADILIVLSNDLQNVLKKDGILILSGILDKYEKKVMNFFQNCQHCETIAKNEWRTIIFQKKV